MKLTFSNQIDNLTKNNSNKKNNLIANKLKNSFIILSFAFAILQFGGYATLTSQAAVDTLSHSVVAKFVDKNANGVADIGDTVDYQFSISNTGPQDITGVSPVKNICAILQAKVDLKVGATDSTTFNCSYPISAADITAGKVVSTTQAWAFSSALNFFAIIYSPELIITTPLVAGTDKLTQTMAATFVDKNGNGTADVGDVIDYVFTIKNDGTTDLTWINPEKASSFGCLALQAKTALKAGEQTSVFTCSHIITADEITAKEVVNTSNAWAYNPALAIIKSTEETLKTPLTVTPPLVDKLTQTMAATFVDKNGNGTADVGDVIDYVFTIKNDGTTDLTWINPEKASSFGCLALQAKTALKAGEQTSVFTCSHIITADEITAKEVVNTSNAWAYNPALAIIKSTEETLKTPLTVTPPLVDKLTQTVTTEVIGDGKVGDVIEYTYTFKNTDEKEVISVVRDPSTGVVCDKSESFTVKPGESSVITCKYTISAEDVAAGEVNNNSKLTAYDQAGKLLSNSTAETLTKLTAVTDLTGDYTLTKKGSYVDVNSNGDADAGDRVDYTFTVENTTTDILKTIMVTDPLCTVTGSLAQLAVDAIDDSTFKCSYTIRQVDVLEEQVVNTAKSTALDKEGFVLTATSNTVTTKLPFKVTALPDPELNPNPTPTPTPTPVPVTTPVVTKPTVTYNPKSNTADTYKTGTPRTGGESNSTMSIISLLVLASGLSLRKTKKIK